MTTVLEAGRATVPRPGILGAGFRGATFGIVLVVTLLAFESMAVGTVMPVVAGDLNGLSLYAWGFSATLITSLLSIVLTGGWVDRSGPVRPFMAGLGTFVAGLLVAGAAPSMGLFVAGRAVQGLGTGVAMVALYVVIARVYPENLRSRVFGALSMASAAVVGLAGLALGLPRLLPAGTLRLRRGLPSVILVRGLLSGAFFGTDVFIPLALTRLHDFSAAQAGIVLTVGALGWSAASQIQARSERPREFYALLGAVFVTAGIILAVIALQLSGWLAAPAWIIGGAGMGFSIGSLSVLLLDLSPEDEQGVNSSALQISDTLGSSLVVGAAGALVAGFGGARLGTGLAVAGALFAAIAALGVIAALRLEVRK